ncbi:MAG: hypothetical protein GF355_03810 [Candidatus Eisenbacteria bacterium]|nr:hypothetical protein [Candidatus Eisenbacteria bacterium]
MGWQTIRALALWAAVLAGLGASAPAEAKSYRIAAVKIAARLQPDGSLQVRERRGASRPRLVPKAHGWTIPVRDTPP